MDRSAWLDIVRESMVATWGLITERTEGGHDFRAEGVYAAIVPATPDRSVMNSVIYSDHDALLGTLDEIARAYEDAGVRAWTVWVPEEDTEAARGLEEAGHVLDAEPRAMGMDLARAQEPDMGELDWFRECELVVVGRINDGAYGYPDGSLGNVITALEPTTVEAYGARVDGEIAAVMMTIDAGTDTEIAWVATTEAARGRGLSTALMRQSVWDARERGQKTATLQATKLGAGVYERVGFEDLGALQMWERRG